MNSDAKLKYVQCIENLSCSALMYMNINRFSIKKELYKNKKDLYKNLFGKRNLQGNKIKEYPETPHIELNRSLFCDLLNKDKESYKLKEFQNGIMKHIIYPFKFDNLSDNNKSPDELNIKTAFFGILANAFCQAIYLFFDKKSYRMKNPRFLSELAMEEFALNKDKSEIIKFPEKPLLQSLLNEQSYLSDLEYGVTKYIIDGLEKYGSQLNDSQLNNSELFMCYFLMLYLWNINTLVADAYLKESHGFHKKFLSPIFLWYLWKDENGEKSTQQKKIIKAVDTKILNKWSLTIYRELINDSDPNNLKAAIQTISEYDHSIICDILYKQIAKPLITKWNEKSNTIDYIKSLRNIENELKNKDRSFRYYFPKAFALDSIGLIQHNPFLSFTGSSKALFNDVSTATLHDIISRKEYSLQCPLQVLQLPQMTIKALLALVDSIVKEFHQYLITELEEKSSFYINEKYPTGKSSKKTNKKLFIELCELFHSNKSYRLNNNNSLPLYRPDYDIWMDTAAAFIVNRIIGKDYLIYNYINSNFDDENMMNLFVEYIYETRINIKNECKKLGLKTKNNEYEKILSNINEDSYAFRLFDTNYKDVVKKDMICYFKTEMRYRYFKFTLFLWWICGYVDYLKKRILRKKFFLHNTDNCQEKKIKSISLARLQKFQMQTCTFAIYISLNSPIRTISDQRGNRLSTQKRVDDLFAAIYRQFNKTAYVITSEKAHKKKKPSVTEFPNPMEINGCKTGTCEECCKELTKIYYDLIK